jgi:hypothetical protein
MYDYVEELVVLMIIQMMIDAKIFNDDDDQEYFKIYLPDHELIQFLILMYHYKEFE